MSLRILRGNLILPDRLLAYGLLVIEDGLIAGVAAGGYQPTEDLGNRFIAPGFIDLHVHGIAGADTMAAGEGSLAAMARALARHGVTGFLPTTVAQSLASIAGVMREAYRYMQRQEKEGPASGGCPAGARVLGVHLEGPWIAREFKGAQNEKYILPPTRESVERILEPYGARVIRIVSLAPELAGAEELMATLRQHGIYVSLGHTGATYGEALRAVELGATQVTHCFNAMSGLHHRRPGVAGAALLSERLFVELIADGIHVHPAVMRLLIQNKGREKVMLVTDAIAAAGLPEGRHIFGGREVHVKSGRACLKDGTLAGSTLTLDCAVRNLIEMGNVALPDAVYMATAAPAEAIGLGERKGRIRAGCDADLTILDQRLRPVQILIAGKNVGSGGRA